MPEFKYSEEQLNSLKENEYCPTINDLPDDWDDDHRKWEDTDEDNNDHDNEREMIKLIRDNLPGVCVIEEPLTCCDELPEEDLTEQLDHIVVDPIEADELFIIDNPDEFLIDDIGQRDYEEDRRMIEFNNK